MCDSLMYQKGHSGVFNYYHFVCARLYKTFVWEFIGLEKKR